MATLHRPISRPHLLIVEEQYLATAFEAITSQYASIEAHLERTAGLDAKRRAASRDALFE
ncbi:MULTISPECIES: tyrosine-protein phosphatase [Pseudomonas]|uniref:tyrosine-protein phosphatase n=1 Tax=Pseudomonas TaxID=286 RepID=UPI00111485F0